MSHASLTTAPSHTLSHQHTTSLPNEAAFGGVYPEDEFARGEPRAVGYHYTIVLGKGELILCDQNSCRIWVEGSRA